MDVADVDERLHPGEPADVYARRVAGAKAEAVLARHPGATVLGADTVVVVDGDVLGKPVDDLDAAAMLRRLSGRAHRVLTAVAVAGDGPLVTAIDETVVWVRDLSAGEIAAYVASGEPHDKAGAYGIQGLASRFIPRIDGSYTNVVGLPMATVDRLLHGVTVIS